MVVVEEDVGEVDVDVDVEVDVLVILGDLEDVVGHDQVRQTLLNSDFFFKTFNY